MFNSKRFKVLAFISFTLIFSYVSTASAGWLYNCDIVKIGSDSNGTSATVDNGYDEYQKYIEEVNAKEILAIMLTADASKKKVHIYLDELTDTFTAVSLSNEL